MNNDNSLELSDSINTTLNPYTMDFIQHMKMQESQFDKQYFQRSPQLSWRRVLIDWLHKIAEKTRLKRSTLHLCAKLLDFFMDGHNVEPGKIYLVAMACLTIAAKFEEKESRVPRVRTLMKCCPRELQVPYTNENHSQMEVMVLQYFNWNVFLPTSNAFVEVLLPQVLDSTDDNLFSNCIQVPIGPNLKETRSKLVTVLKALLRISLQDCYFVKVTPSMMAAALIHSARKVCGVKPAWPKHLAAAIGFQDFEFADCAAKLMGAFFGEPPKIDPEIVGEAKDAFPRTTNGGENRVRGRGKSKRKVQFVEDPTFVSCENIGEKSKVKRSKKSNQEEEAKPKAQRTKPRIIRDTTKNKKVDENVQQRPKRSSRESAKLKAQAQSAVKTESPTTPDEGYGSFSFGSTGVFLVQNPTPSSSKPSVSVTEAAASATVGGGPVMSSIDILLKASDTIEATEIKHESFKEEIIRESVVAKRKAKEQKKRVAAVKKQAVFKEEILREIAANNAVGIESNGTNIEGLNVSHGNLFLYTVVKSE